MIFSQIKIPAGWEHDPQGIINNLAYFYDINSSRWLTVKDHLIAKMEAKTFICQTIDIDLEKQPMELVAWAMDKDGKWYAHEEDIEIPDDAQVRWWCEEQLKWRRMMPSEYPDYSGDWKDSKIIRPGLMDG